MLFAWRYLPALVLAIAVAVLRAAPATADDAQSVIEELSDQGYSVHINWLNGHTVPLSYCGVSNVNTPSDIDPDSGAFATAYVDVSCPNDIY